MIKKPRGFSAMSEEKRLEIARKGGRNVPAHMRSYSQNRELASRSGQKGGKLVKPENRSFSKDRQLAREAGRKGGKKTNGR